MNEPININNDGGPAYPVAAYHHPNGDFEWPRDGMTLRDYFAAKAMQAQITTDCVPGEACEALIKAATEAGQHPAFRLALNSYDFADFMIKARQWKGRTS